MGWSLGFDSNWNRDIGYGVPAYCDHPKCNREIDRGLSYVCGGDPYGGERGCGLFFCGDHMQYHCKTSLCARCVRLRKPFDAKPDHPAWIEWKLTDESWEPWRKKNPQIVAEMKKLFAGTQNEESRNAGDIESNHSPAK